MDITERYAFDQYVLRQKFFKLFGASFHIFDPQGNVVLFSKQKAFKIKEDIRVYTDESLETEALVIRTQSIFDIAGTYDVFDPIANETVGAVKRKGLKSLLKDEWLILDAQGNEIGKVVEDSTLKAIVRRVVEAATLIIPSAYHVEIGGQTAAVFKQDFNPFLRKFNLDFTHDTTDQLDPRLGIAAAILLCAIEGDGN
ncbi:MAG: hypothetical protein AAGA25_09965 [Planctomycetota bacterium]